MADPLSNPHIPDFMAKAPWYGGGGGKGDMAHQRKAEPIADQTVGSEGKAWGFTVHYKRGEFAGQATKYRKGACKNCGAMTHAEKDCVDRPRSRGAWKTNSDIKPDEFIQANLATDFDAKRDKYNGYDVEQHQQTIARFALAEEERKRLRAEAKAKEEEERRLKKEADRQAKEAKRKQREEEKRKKQEEGAAGDDSDATASQIGSGTDTDSSSESDTDYSSSGSDDGIKERSSALLVGQSVESANTKAKMSVRNLRLREDRAKYLINLDVNSAHYDPKARSMRENPNPEDGEALYQGDNAWLQSGAVSDLMNTQVFAWEASQRGVDVVLQANPTQLELLKKQHQERKALLSQAHKQKVMEKYGTAADVVEEDIPREMLLGQGEVYVEYSRDGRIIKGMPAASTKSRFPEDVHPGNHTSVWGSWYDVNRHEWGYACCRNTHYHAYCTGKAGIEAAEASARLAASGGAAVQRVANPSESTSGSNSTTKPNSKRADLYGEAAHTELDPEKLKAALARASKRPREANSEHGYHSVQGESAEMTAEDMEAYRIKRFRAGDPMANMGDEDAV